MVKKILSFSTVLVLLLTGCNNQTQTERPDNTGLSDPIAENPFIEADFVAKTAGYTIGIKGENARFISDDIIQVPLTLNSEEGCEKIGVRVYIDGILQDFAPDNSEKFLNHNIMSAKTDDTDYLLNVKAVFDKNMETHMISALSVYNPDFTPRQDIPFGHNHKANAGAFHSLSIADEELHYADNAIIYKADDPLPIDKNQAEVYHLKNNNDTSFLLMQNADESTYTINENGSCSLKFIAGTQAAGNEKYRVSFYKNHELVPFNEDYFYLDISLEGGKISITDIEIDNLQDGDFLYCISVPTVSYNAFAYPQKTDTVVAVKSE